MRPTSLGLGLTLGSGRRYLPWLNHGGPSTWPLVLLEDGGITLVGSSVSAWADVATGNGKAFTQADSLKQAAYVSSDAAYGGRPSLDFAGSKWMSGVTWSMAVPMTWYAVGNYGTDSGFPGIFDGRTSSGRQTIYVTRAGSTVNAYNGTGLAGGVIADAPHVFAATFSPTVGNICVDSPTPRASGNTGSTASDGVTLGAFPGGSNPWGGKICALLVHVGADDAATRARVMRWLGNRYRITIT